MTDSGEGSNERDGKIIKNVQKTAKTGRKIFIYSWHKVLIDYWTMWLSPGSVVSLSLWACCPVCVDVVLPSACVKYPGIGSGIWVSTWKSLYLAFLQASNVRSELTNRLGGGRLGLNSCVSVYKPTWLSEFGFPFQSDTNVIKKCPLLSTNQHLTGIRISGVFVFFQVPSHS